MSGLFSREQIEKAAGKGEPVKCVIEEELGKVHACMKKRIYLQ